MDLVMDAKPNLTWEQESRQLKRRVIPESHAAGVLKKKPQKEIFGFYHQINQLEKLNHLLIIKMMQLQKT